MKFDRPQAVSFKPVPDGDYVGVLVGFSYIGMHSTKEWGDKPKIMLRWELHELDAPNKICTDDEDLINVVAQVFPATIRGDQSWLNKCLVAHGIVTPGGSCADSHDWYGKVAIVSVEGAQGNRGDRVFMNVIDIKPLDFDVNISPSLKYEHWEPEDENPPPMWARAMISKSMDIYDRADQSKGQSSRPSAVGGRPTPGAGSGSRGYDTDRPSNPSSSYQPPAGGYQPVDQDEEDIPF